VIHLENVWKGVNERVLTVATGRNEGMMTSYQRSGRDTTAQQEGIHQQHSMVQVEVQGVEGREMSSVSSPVEGDHARIQHLLQCYFTSLVQSGNLEEEFNLVTAKVGKIFKGIKIINADEQLSRKGIIAKTLMKEINVPPTFQEIWWDQMKSHVHKKLDEWHSNCGTAIKKCLTSKFQAV